MTRAFIQFGNGSQARRTRKNARRSVSRPQATTDWTPPELNQPEKGNEQNVLTGN